MADKLISDLDPQAFAETDLLEHEPGAGAPSKKGTVKELFTEPVFYSGGGVLPLWESTLGRFYYPGTASIGMDFGGGSLGAIDGTTVMFFNDRRAVSSDATLAFDWENRQLITSSTPALDWGLYQLFAPGSVLSIDWDVKGLYSGGDISIDYSARRLHKADGSVAVDWEVGTGILDLLIINQPARTLIDSAAVDSIEWETRRLFATDGTTVLDYSTQQPSSGPQTAGAVYTATEQVMLQECYDAMRAYGLLS